ncbi:MAG: hypothetical protein ACRDP6_29470 [Actinoallomurus sp.]
MMAQQEVPVYGWWGEVPGHLRSLTQLRDGEFPREPAGPVRAWVQTRDWRDRKDEVPLYDVAESRPTAASARQLEAAARRRSAVVRLCGDCGARCEQPLPVEQDGRALCPACRHIARLRAEQVRLAGLRDKRSAWAADLLADEALAVLEVELFVPPPSPSGRKRPAAALHAVAVDRDGAVLLDQVARLASPRAAAVPEGAPPVAEVAVVVNSALAGRTLVVWDGDGFDQLARAIREAGQPYEGGRAEPLALAVAEWRGDLEPRTRRIRTSTPPGRADRLLVLLRRMAAATRPDEVAPV